MTNFEKLSLLTDHIIERYDTLPKVEEEVGFGGESTVPTLEITETIDSGDAITVYFKNTGGKVMVILNDAIIGISEGDSVTVGELNRGLENELVLIPMSETRRGERKIVKISSAIKAPDTGRPGA